MTVVPCKRLTLPAARSTPGCWAMAPLAPMSGSGGTRPGTCQGYLILACGILTHLPSGYVLSTAAGLGQLGRPALYSSVCSDTPTGSE